jgi:protein-S-isoprenylcysteine O-methyltransferase Ste14
MRRFFEYQIWHLLAAIIMLLVAREYVQNTSSLNNEIMGFSATFWFWAGLWLAIGHQALVMLVWRAQLHFQWIESRFGPQGFTNYGRAFALFSFLRLFTVLILAFATPGSLTGNSTLLKGGGFLFIALVTWLMYSVMRYFGIDRALGGDHFEDKYRKLGLVKGGIFNYIRNGMYIVGLLVLWIPGLLLASEPALLQGLLGHAFIWAHYFFTEKPDMMRIYGDVAA